MILFNAIKTGLIKAYKLCIKICKIIIPVYFVIKLLDYSGLLHEFSSFLSPVMSVFGLPGSTALVLILGNSINIYAAIAALATVSLNSREMTILATMIGFSHSLIMETSILKGLKVKVYLQIIFRMGLSLLVGIIMNLVWR